MTLKYAFKAPYYDIECYYLGCFSCEMNRCKELQKYLKENKTYTLNELYARGLSKKDFIEQYDKVYKEFRMIINTCKNVSRRREQR